MRFTKSDIKFFKRFALSDSEIKNIAKNTRKIKIFNNHGERITHKKFLQIAERYKFLGCLAYAYFHKSATAAIGIKRFYFERA